MARAKTHSTHADVEQAAAGNAAGESTGAASPTPTPSENDGVTGSNGSRPGDIEQRLKEAEREAEENKNLYLRAMADIQNIRRRAAQENEAAREFATQELVLRLLPVLDNFELAIRHSESSHNFDALLQGVNQIYRQLRDVLAREGVEPIEAVGSQFDPEHHEAIGHHSTEEYEEGSVAEDLRTGYRMKGKLIRPSLVKVASR